MNEDYIVRYGNNDTYINRTDYMCKKEALKAYDKINLGNETGLIWKELLYEPLEEKETQYIIKSDSVKIVDLGICKIAVPEK